jgi:hypothetical protein
MNGFQFKQFISLLVISLLLVPSLLMPSVPSFSEIERLSSSSHPSHEALDSDQFNELTNGLGNSEKKIRKEEREWYWRDALGSWHDYRDAIDTYRHVADGIRHRQTSYFPQTGSGLVIRDKVDGNRLHISIRIGSYNIITYAFDQGIHQTVIVEEAELSMGYGLPTLPYKNLLLTLPENVHPLTIQVNQRLMESIDGLSLAPGPEPLHLASNHRNNPQLYFEEDAYSTSTLMPTSLVEYQEVGMRGTKGLLVSLNLMQYNPVQKHGNLIVALDVVFTLSESVSSKELHLNPYESQYNDGGQGYVIIAPSSFVPSLDSFQQWKQNLGYDVSIMPVETIYATYSGRDNAERMRTFIQASYTQNNTLFFFLIGDSDVVPTREVWDPYYAGGLDNGTEPSDMYFECLDGDWDTNGNSLFGETDDNVDFYPEVLVGRIPVQTVTQAEDVLDAIIQLESNPAPGSWMNDFLLIGPDCFGWGDGANMIEEELNQQFLYDSFFDVFRTYPTDGSLSNTTVINRINTGVGLVDFFDHGWYGGWYEALNEEAGSEVSNLLNGAKTPFAFAMACETAAFDAETYEPTIGEAFFRNPNGGAVAYIGATRIAWAGYHAFDGLHNRFWHYFFDTALTEWYASPKLALHAARQEMVTTYSMTDPVSLETVYQAIYFGDPSMSLYWKHNVTNSVTQVEINEVVQLNGTCNLLYNNTPISDTVNVLVRDPLGHVVYNSPHITDAQGKYTATFTVSEVAGNYTVETIISQPFAYTAVNTFYVGNHSLTLQLDSSPQYFNFLDFSGSATADGTGNATLLDSEGNLLSSKLFNITGGAYSESLNLTAFGWLILHVTLESGMEHGGVSTNFLVRRGDILVIADDTGAFGPDYPGGWTANNRGDSTNLGDYYVALKSEYAVSIFYPRYEREPSLSLLQSYDAVIVTVGDNFGYPLISPDSFLLDVLFSYHNSGGQILFEGCLMSEDLANSMHNATFKSLTHTEHVKNLANTGSLTLENTLHTITSGLPATIVLLDGLGTPYADVITAFNGSTRVSGYVGEVAPHAAITALTPTPTYGGVVYIGFSIDAISNQDNRTLLIQNAIAFLLQPSIGAILSDDAVQTGTTETIIIEVFEAATGQPISGAEVTFNGCGISATNHSTSFGNCSLIITPTSAGIITVQITKYGFLNLTGGIIIYDLPIIEVNTIPTYLVRTTSQDLVVIATNYYEHFPLDGCFINITGCGVSDTGFTNSSGMVEFTVSPTISGLISIHANLSAYVNVTSSIGVRLIALVLPSAGTEYPSEFCWDEINLNWQDYGTIPLFINYTTFAGTNTSFTIQDLETSNADALIIPYLFESYSPQEIEAINTYVRAGHGLFASGFAIALHSESMGTFFGVKENLFFDTYYSLSNLNILQLGHAIFLNLHDPLTTSYPFSFYPMGTGWDLSVLQGASYLAMDTSGSNYGTILTYRGIVYTSYFPELLSNRDDRQLVYNILTWSEYEIPDHELRVSLATPSYCEPGDTVKINTTVYNEGLNNETNLFLQLFIDSLQVASLPIPELANFTSETLSYLWTPLTEAIYNITAYVAPVQDETDTSNNMVTRFVTVRPIEGWILWDSIHLTDPMSYYSDWLTELTNLGYVIEEISSGSITPVLLDSYDILICAQPYASYSSAEQTAIQSFVLNGGGLLVIGDDSPTIFDMLTLFAGIDWELGGYAGTTSDITPHPVTTDVFSAHFDSPICELMVSGGAISLIRNGGDTLLAASEVGSGRVLGIGDEHTIQDGSINQADNRQLALNMIDWLRRIQYIHDLHVFLEVPLYGLPGDPVSINATVRNSGLENETNITVRFYVNTSLEDTIAIPELNSSDSIKVGTVWTTSTLGHYNITAFIVPVPLENVTTNNIDTRWIRIREISTYVLFDRSHENMFEENYTEWFAELYALGISIDILYSGPIDSATLNSYNALMCTNPWLNYSSAELTAIQTFVENGGGLFVTGGWNPTVASSLTAPFGITYEYDFNSSIVSDITDHPVTEDVDYIYLEWMETHLIVSSPAISLARTPVGDTILAVSESCGRVVGFASGVAFSDYLIQTMDNFQLAVNIITWLSDDNIAPLPPILNEITEIITSPDFSVTWSAASDPDGIITLYHLQLDDDTAFIGVIGSWSTSDTNYTVTLLLDGTYYLRVRARDDGGRFSSLSNVITITVELPNLLPLAPVLSISDFTGTTVTLSWTESEDRDGYVSNYLIQMSPNPAFTFISGTWFINDTSLAIANLPAGPCYFRVSAIDNEDALGEWSNICDVLVPGIPITIFIAIAAIIAISIIVIIAAYWRFKRRIPNKG